MKKYFKMIAFVLPAFLLCQLSANGQEVKDSTKKAFKNTIRINLTSPMIFSTRYLVIGYERILMHNQSFSINAGRFALPNFVQTNFDSLQLKRGSSDKGFTIAADYRFYLTKENKYNAPRGVYIGPYYSFASFERVNTWSMNTANMNGELKTDMKLNLNMVGAQLGYQFVIKNRIALDLIFMGPGVWFYNLKTTVSSSLSAADESLLFEKLNEILAAKLPGHEILIQPGQYQKTGAVRAYSAGFRYLIHIGFRF
jgi:hypothetical protein